MMSKLFKDYLPYLVDDQSDQAKAKEDMWLPLGEGWKYDKIDDFYWKNEEGTSIRIDVSPRYIHINYFQGVCKIPCEICTLEIVQGIIKQINKHYAK